MLQGVGRRHGGVKWKTHDERLELLSRLFQAIACVLDHSLKLFEYPFLRFFKKKEVGSSATEGIALNWCLISVLCPHHARYGWCEAKRERTYSIFDLPLIAVLCDHSVDFALLIVRFLFVQIVFLEQPVFIP